MNIKDLRKITGLTQGRFGEKYHIPVRTLQHWENGDRQPMECIEYLLERVIVEDYKMGKIEITGNKEENNFSDIQITIGDVTYEYDISGWGYFSIEENVEGIMSDEALDDLSKEEKILLKTKLEEFFEQ